MNIPILYEDADVVVVNKPSGLMVHPDGRGADESARTKMKETIADWHVARVPTARGVGEPLAPANGASIDRPGVVHRLDRETSGALILAKTRAAFLHLKEQFHERRVRKEYRAFVYGQMREVRGVIARAVGRSARDFRLRSAQRGARGPLRSAQTEWERLGVATAYSYVRLFPKTGRTHQLRAHLKAINHPIIEDYLYAPKRATNDPHALGFQRLALHAYALTLTLPSGEHRTCIAPLPEDFARAEDIFRNMLP